MTDIGDELLNSPAKSNKQQWLCLLKAENAKIPEGVGYKPGFNIGGLMAKRKEPRLTESVRGAG